MSKIKEVFEQEIRDADSNGLYQQLKNMEHQYVQYEQFEDLILLSEKSMKSAFKMYLTLDDLSKVYFVQKHIDYTKQPRQLYKLNMFIVNHTF